MTSVNKKSNPYASHLPKPLCVPPLFDSRLRESKSQMYMHFFYPNPAQYWTISLCTKVPDNLWGIVKGIFTYLKGEKLKFYA